MIAFIVRRVFASIGVMIAVGLIAFAMFRYVGDPVNQMVGVETSVAERAQLREELGLNDPAIVQAARFLGNAARFDFGVSYQFKEPVADLIGARMPATLELAFVASILSLVAGIPMGVYAALHRDSALSRLFQALSLIGISLPTFLTGILLDHSLLGDARLAAVLRPRRGGAPRPLVDDRISHRLRAQIADHAGDHARPLPDDADHAARSRRNARSFAQPTISASPAPAGFRRALFTSATP